MTDGQALNGMTFVKDFKPRNLRVIIDKGRTLICAFEGTLSGRDIFNIREVYETYGEWAPGKGVSVPLEKKEEFLRGLKLYIDDALKVPA